MVSRNDLCVMTPSSLSVRHLSSATAERPFTRAGPTVRIRFPPVVSRQTIGSSAAEPTEIGGYLAIDLSGERAWQASDNFDQGLLASAVVGALRLTRSSSVHLVDRHPQQGLTEGCRTQNPRGPAWPLTQI
jgi:hypothetical protein